MSGSEGAVACRSGGGRGGAMVVHRAAATTGPEPWEEDRRRGRPTALSPQQAGQLLRGLRMAAATRQQGGLTALLVCLMADGSEQGEDWVRLRDRVEASLMAALRERLEWKRPQWVGAHQSNLGSDEGRAAARAYMNSILTALRQRAATEPVWLRESVDTRASSRQATRSEQPERVGAAAALRRSPAVGTLSSQQPDVRSPLTTAGESAATVPEWEVAQRPVERRATDIIPRRRTCYQPAHRESQEQWQRVAAQRLGRLLPDDGCEWYFNIGDFSDALRKKRRRGDEGSMTAEELAQFAGPDVLPATTASPTGHPWGVRQLAPLDVRQQLSSMGMGEWAPQVEKVYAEGLLKEPQMRSAIGMATHAESVRIVWERTLQRLPPRWHRRRRVTMGALGLGLGFTALQLAAQIEGGADLVWAAEGCPLVGPAAARLVALCGHECIMLPEADGRVLASGAWQVTVEVITLSCYPFSTAGTARELEPHLTELKEVLEGLCTRKPRVVIYENTAGLWRTPEIRQRVEAMLVCCRAYEWESTRVDPKKHAGVGISRDRIFYVGVRGEGAGR